MQARTVEQSEKVIYQRNRNCLCPASFFCKKWDCSFYPGRI